MIEQCLYVHSVLLSRILVETNILIAGRTECTFLFFQVGLPTDSSEEPYLSPEMITVMVVDQDNLPVQGVNVSFSFRNYPKDDEFNVVTDNHGYAQAKKQGDRRVSITVDKNGYYYSTKVIDFEEQGREGSSSHDNIYTVVLKKKRKPIPMYAKKIHSMRISTLDIPIGYDLEIGDWVTPYGKGKTKDFIFLFRNEMRGKNDFTSSFELTFSNDLDGIQEFQFNKEDNSVYRWPFDAPTADYKKMLSKYISKKPNE